MGKKAWLKAIITFPYALYLSTKHCYNKWAYPCTYDFKWLKKLEEWQKWCMGKEK